MFFKPFPYTTYEFNLDGIKTNIIDIFRYVQVQSEFLDDANSYKFYQIHEGERPDIVSSKLYGTPDYYWTFFIINDTLREGLSGWPLSSQQFEDYMDEEYNGVVLNGRPEVIRDSDGLVIDNRDSVAGRFLIGEEIVGFLSGARGTLVGKDLRHNQLILENVTGTFQAPEIVRGQRTLDSISTHEVFERELAPKYYLDPDGNIVDNALFTPGGYVNPTYINHREWETDLNEKRSAIRVIREEFIEDFVLNFRRLLNGRL